MARDQQYKIYVLVDPRTQDVRYVGSTCNLDARGRQHCGCGINPSNPRLDAWRRELRDAGLEPEVQELATIGCEQELLCTQFSSACEKFAIKWYREYNRHWGKKPLLNIAGNPDYKRTQKGYRIRPHVVVD
jgi:hypothetical protein